MHPETMFVWPLYGAGLENFGQDERLVALPVPRPADQILVRSDAVGFYHSDVKIIHHDQSRLYAPEVCT